MLVLLSSVGHSRGTCWSDKEQRLVANCPGVLPAPAAAETGHISFAFLIRLGANVSSLPPHANFFTHYCSFTRLLFPSTMASEYDIIIIGGGPSGLSAAASIVRQDHKTVLFDSGKYRNSQSKHMHTMPSWDHQDPETFRAASRADFKRYSSITIENAEVESLRQREDGVFEATSGGTTWTGKKVILATGVEDVFPDIPGYAECWVSGM